LFASIGKSIVHILTGRRAWPCGKPSKCVVAGLGGVQPDHLTCHWQPSPSETFEFIGAPLGDDGPVHHKKAALTLFACLFKLCLPLGLPKLEFGCFARVPDMAEGVVGLYERHCQLRALQQFDSVVREAYSSITGLHDTPSALLQRPLGSIQSSSLCSTPPLTQFTDLQSHF